MDSTRKVFAITADGGLEPLPFTVQVVNGETQLLVTSQDIAAAHQRAAVRAGRFGTPRALRRSPLAEPLETLERGIDSNVPSSEDTSHD
jgi:hypothetical protein